MKKRTAVLTGMLAAGMMLGGIVQGVSARENGTEFATETDESEETELTETEENAVAVTVNGVEIFFSEAEAIADYILSQYESIGYDVENEATVEYAEKAALTILIQLEVTRQKAEELGLNVLSEEETAALELQAARLTEQYEYDSVEVLLDDLENSVIFDRLEEYCTQDVTVSDAEVREQYEEYLKMDQENFADNVPLYESMIAAYGSNESFYLPKGYRHLEYIRLKKASDDPEAEEKLKEIQEKFANGTSFAELAGEYSIDQGDNVGVSIHADSVLWEAEFVEAAMAIEAVGEISEPVECEDGIYILYYESDVEGGPLEYTDTVKEKISGRSCCRRQKTKKCPKCWSSGCRSAALCTTANGKTT